MKKYIFEGVEYYVASEVDHLLSEHKQENDRWLAARDAWRESAAQDRKRIAAMEKVIGKIQTASTEVLKTA